MMTLSSKLRAELDSLGIFLRRERGQHLLLDENIANRQVELAAPAKNDVVLEVGPGLGVLTKRLVEHASKVIAIEKDDRFVSYLSERLPANASIIHADALKYAFPDFSLFVSNIPYQISSPLIFKLLEHDFNRGVIMLQKEFADRLVAVPCTKDYSRISIGVQYRCKCEIIEEVPASSFFPKPKVDSVIISLEPRPPPFVPLDEDLFFVNFEGYLVKTREDKEMVEKILPLVKTVMVGSDLNY